MRRAVLILAGYMFFWSFSQWLVGYLIAVSGLVYGAGRWMEQLKETGKTRSKGLPSKERSAVKKQYKAKEKRSSYSRDCYFTWNPGIFKVL